MGSRRDSVGSNPAGQLWRFGAQSIKRRSSSTEGFFLDFSICLEEFDDDFLFWLRFFFLLLLFTLYQ